MNSRLAEQARQAQVADVRRMTAEQRLMAFLTHCQLMAKLQRAGTDLRARAARPVRPDAD
jgi:hypothetical protein